MIEASDILYLLALNDVRTWFRNGVASWSVRSQSRHNRLLHSRQCKVASRPSLQF
jgi:hypothetical protein